MSCEPTRPAPLRCPTLPERIAAMLALLPFGRAWGSDDGSHEPHHDAAFDAAAFDPNAFDTRSMAGSIIWRFFAAAAAVLHFAETRLCDLRREFFCATAVETRDLWMAEYGLPGACDPFPDLCAKVAAIGGARCEYYQAVAARAGWAIQCRVVDDECGGMAGCIEAGCFVTGSANANALAIDVFLDQSPAFNGGAQTPPEAGLMYAGAVLSCAPDISSLRCLMERIVHAHVEVVYFPV